MQQADHARLAADVLALVRLPELAGHPRRAALLSAVAEHDNGWWESDAAPRFDPVTRRPVDFRAIPDEERREIWRRGVERHAEGDPYVAALIAGHALRLLVRRGEADPEWGSFLADLEEQREELALQAGLSSDELRRDDRWLELADQLALAGASGDAAFFDQDGSRLEVLADEEATDLALAPFPLAGSTRCELSCRRLPLESAGTDLELVRALATARWERRVVHFTPLAGLPR